MSDFSISLNEDQIQIQKWIHDFGETVVRPAAEEWDEREEFPWPVVQEAAKIGLYGFEGIAQFFADPTGLTLPIVNEELFWGDAGIGMSIFGTSLAVAAIVDAVIVAVAVAIGDGRKVWTWSALKPLRLSQSASSSMSSSRVPGCAAMKYGIRYCSLPASFENLSKSSLKRS